MVAYCNQFFGFKTRKRRYLLVQFVVGSRSYCERFFFNDSGFPPLLKGQQFQILFRLLPNSLQLFITAIPWLLSMSIKRLETPHTFHIRAMIIYRIESLYVHSCFRCTSLEKDET